ncbi:MULTISPECIES: hypothetical protein [unclassified Nocardioides]|uniref:hypothetical protein n=1 Tax=unclassified Nocardioides TaxID=2615069 RepID=UPI000056FBE5|nr:MULTISPECIES: hypothetical protein [unclassified Nocardioides]
MEVFAPLMMLGARVREVGDLDEGALWVPQRRLLLIDANLSAARRAEVADLFLADVFADTSTTENA